MLGHAAEARGQVHAAARPPLSSRARHVAVDRDVGAAEAVDRLLRIADDEEAAGDGRDRAPVGCGGIVGGEQQQDLGLQRVGVLELVDEDVREALLEAAPHGSSLRDEVARLEQQVEEVERAGARLQLLVAVDGAHQLLLQRRGEVGVGVHPELIEVRAQRVERVDDAAPRDALPVAGAAAVPGLAEVPVARQIDEPRFPSVVVRRRPNDLVQPDLLAQVARRRGVEIQVVTRRRTASR